MDLLDLIQPTTTVPTPAGMVAVTQDQFFAYINPRDVNPRCAAETYSDWETRDRLLVGRSFPGWKSSGDEEAYFLTLSARSTQK